GNTYRLRPDGSRVEPFTRGQVNPFGLAFDPLGNLYSCDCHSRPIYQLLRGAYYPSFGKPHDGLGYGPEMMNHDHGSTGIGGIALYAADGFPAPYRDTLFVGNVVTSRINHDRIEWHGSSPRALAQPDFLTSDDPWFRPVDIELGPDGALYVADFYNKIIGHYEVPLTHPGRDRTRGRIWRIIYRGPDDHAPPISPRPDWTTATVAELIEDLGHPNIAVRFRATNQLAARRGIEVNRAVLEAMKDGSNPYRRMHGLWVLDRRGALDDATLRAGAGDGAEGVRVHAMRVLAERPNWTSPLRALALAGLNDPSLQVRRAAADALGRHPAPEDVRPLLDLRHAVAQDDTHLLHVVRMALRDQLLPAGAWAHLPAALSVADTRALADVALGVSSPEAARFLVGFVRGPLPDPDERIRAAHHIARHGDDDSGAALLAFGRGDRPDDLAHQAALLRAVQQGTQERGVDLDEEVRRWGGTVARRLLDAPEADRRRAGAELAGSLRLVELEAPLAALTALMAIAPEPPVGRLGGMLADATEPVSFREQVALRLAQINRPEAQGHLARTLPTAPGRLQAVIAVGLAGTVTGAETLLDLVAAGKASARILQERLVEIRLEATNLPGLADRLARLRGSLPPTDTRLQQVIDRRRSEFAPDRADATLG
ncbi:MAG TPA: dehydrogenase, partial [Isosphaeraceae bacterium]